MGMNPDDTPATKGNLKLLKKDLEFLKGDLMLLNDGLALLADDLREFRRSTTRELGEFRAGLDKFEKSFREDLRAMESKISKQFASFRWARKSDHAKIIADWRVAELKKRVGKTEPRPS